MKEEIDVFYGFAENKESEINFNFPVIVDIIKAQQGDIVKAGDTLLSLKRIKSKVALEDENYKINRVIEDKNFYIKQQNNEVSYIQQKGEEDILLLEQKKKAIELEILGQKKLLTAIGKSDDSLGANNTLMKELGDVINEINVTKKINSEKILLVKQTMKQGIKRYDSDINLLNASLDFNEETKVIYDYLIAPIDGIIGDIQCKEGEHIPSFKTLLSIYEKNPILVKGYIYENSKLDLDIGDSVEVFSLSNIENQAPGLVTGIGSRIVEIPQRLRKIKDMVIYGKEVLIEVPSDNPFLQKEKVSINFTEI
jgi:multidrug resistance efflux pump